MYKKNHSTVWDRTDFTTYNKVLTGAYCKVIYAKYSKHWPYTVAHTIDCLCSKILNHGLNHCLFLSLFNFSWMEIHSKLD